MAKKATSYASFDRLMVMRASTHSGPLDGGDDGEGVVSPACRCGVGAAPSVLLGGGNETAGQRKLAGRLCQSHRRVNLCRKRGPNVEIREELMQGGTLGSGKQLHPRSPDSNVSGEPNSDVSLAGSR